MEGNAVDSTGGDVTNGAIDGGGFVFCRDQPAGAKERCRSENRADVLWVLKAIESDHEVAVLWFVQHSLELRLLWGGDDCHACSLTLSVSSSALLLSSSGAGGDRDAMFARCLDYLFPGASGVPGCEPDLAYVSRSALNGGQDAVWISKFEEVGFAHEGPA